MILNKSHLQHGLYAFVLQVMFYPVSLVIGGVFACSVFLGREICQHEWKEARRLRLTSLKELPNPFVGVYKHWTIDSILDVAIPVVVCSIVALIL